MPRISGIVKVPVVAALATALPESDPIRPLASTATFAGPPARVPKSRWATPITQPVAPANALDETRLAAWMAANVAGFQGPLSVAQFKGGQSNPTYLLTAGGHRYVLRRKPLGDLLPSAHAVDREFRVISALARTKVPVAKAHVLCEDPAVIGTAFYVMDCVDGRVLWDPTLPGMSPAERGAIYAEMNRVIAALHAALA